MLLYLKAGDGDLLITEWHDNRIWLIEQAYSNM